MSIDRVSELGIVGAGGGGFPTAVKLGTRVPLVIANAAECEPLLHKDKELLHHHAGPFLRGMVAAMEMVGAPQGVIGIKRTSAWRCCRTPTRRATSSSWCISSPAASSRPAACPRT
jgi:Na+-translocating ferredoxin:NAD+ oxidoreductase RnfC subunit